MVIKTFAPVLIPTLNRFDHFRRCLESLEKCTWAEKTDVYVALDYPPSEKYVEGWKKIDSYLLEKEKYNGFKKLYVRRREQNCGVGKPNSNSSLLLDEVRRYSDRYIFSEDDNEFSPNFLDYINKGLEIYKEDERIFAICGYNYQQIDMKGYDHEYYFSHEISAWGYGSWFIDRIDYIRATVRKPGYLIGLVKSVPMSKFLSNGTKLCNLLEDIGLAFHGDSYYTYYEWSNNIYCVFPTVSLVRNFGHDGSGEHCVMIDGYNPFINQIIDERKTFDSKFDLPIEYNPIIQKKFTKFQTGSFLKRCQKIMMLILMKLFIKIRRF